MDSKERTNGHIISYWSRFISNSNQASGNQTYGTRNHFMDMYSYYELAGNFIFINKNTYFAGISE